MADSHLVKHLRQQAIESPGKAAAFPFLLMIPYFILAFGTETFSFVEAGKLAAYIAAPTLLLLPDRTHHAHRAGWRDFAALLAIGLPVGAGWLDGIWAWPPGVDLFRPLVCVCVAAYTFIVIRGLEDVGFRLLWRKGDLGDGLANFAAFALIGIPLAYWIGFIHFHVMSVSSGAAPFEFLGIYFGIAIPEELFFRGILQNFLVKTLPPSRRRGIYGLLIASAIFGVSHLQHAPAPNWRYGILAAIAGLFYGNAYRSRNHLAAAALTHALVDAVWRFWL
jgi:membrane protease YdiL (CAAX protease family)